MDSSQTLGTPLTTILAQNPIPPPPDTVSGVNPENIRKEDCDTYLKRISELCGDSWKDAVIVLVLILIVFNEYVSGKIHGIVHSDKFGIIPLTVKALVVSLVFFMLSRFVVHQC